MHLVQSAFSAEFKMLLTGAHPIGPLAFSTFNSGNDSCEKHRLNTDDHRADLAYTHTNTHRHTHIHTLPTGHK